MCWLGLKRSALALHLSVLFLLMVLVELPSPAVAGDFPQLGKLAERVIQGCRDYVRQTFGPYWTFTEDGCVSKPLKDSMSDPFGRCTPLEVQGLFADAVIAQNATGWGQALEPWYVSSSTKLGTYDRLAFLAPTYSLTVEGFATQYGGFMDRYVLDVQIKPDDTFKSLTRVSLDVRIHRELEEVNRANAKTNCKGSMYEAQQAFLNALFLEVVERAKTACH